MAFGDDRDRDRVTYLQASCHPAGGHVQVPEPVRKDGAFIDSFVITGNVSSEENVSVYGCSFIGIVSVDGTE